MRSAENEEEIKCLINRRVEAIKNKDIEGATKNYSPDLILFDVIGPLQHTGSGSIKKRLEDWFSTFKDNENVGFEIAALSITADTDAAFCHSLNHANAILKDGNKLDMWWRETLNWQKIDGEWQVTHAHSSVPFDVNSGKPSLGLKPEDVEV